MAANLGPALALVDTVLHRRFDDAEHAWDVIGVDDMFASIGTLFAQLLHDTGVDTVPKLISSRRHVTSMPRLAELTDDTEVLDDAPLAAGDLYNAAIYAAAHGSRGRTIFIVDGPPDRVRRASLALILARIVADELTIRSQTFEEFASTYRLLAASPDNHA